MVEVVVATINEDNIKKWENMVKTIEIEIMGNHPNFNKEDITNKIICSMAWIGKDNNMVVKIKGPVCTRIKTEE